MSTGAPIEIWRSGVPPWECDEMGHMNVRFYVAHAMRGLMTLAAHLGLPHAFAPNATSTLIVREHHIRFLKEARGGAALYMTGAVLSMGETDAVLLQTLVHSLTGDLCATVVTRVTHASARDLRPFPWPARSRAKAQTLTVTAPPQAGPRGIAGDAPMIGTLKEADERSMTCISRGGIGAQDCDVFGRMRTEMVMGQLSNALPMLAQPMREALKDSGLDPRKIGGAVVEYRLTYLGAPRAGDLCEARSGAAAVASKVMHIHHWLLDPISGNAWAVAESIVGYFDLEARKMIALPEEALKVVQRILTPGLPTILK